MIPDQGHRTNSALRSAGIRPKHSSPALDVADTVETDTMIHMRRLSLLLLLLLLPLILGAS